MTALDEQQVLRLREAASEPAAGDVIDDRFELIEVIGEGGMGLVWSALDRTSGQHVALKIVGVSDDADDRLQREADAMARLNHAAIVRTLVVGEAEGVRYVAMELLSGYTLAERIADSRLSIAETVVLGQRIADALATLHREGLVHRDVKPSNLFLVDRDASSTCLLDFGLIKALDGPKVTKTGVVLGTPGYMAPEQVRGERSIGPGADVFALGCVLFECIVGEPLFHGESDEALFARILLEQAPPLADQRADTPSWLGQLVADMLRKNASERPDARAVVERLARGASTESSSTEPQGWDRGRLVADRYRIERVIGEGGMGIVVAARHLELGKLVALKVLRKRASPTDEARFLREARAAARLENEHVARVLDAGRIDEVTPFIAMELLDGEDVAQLLRSRGALPIDEAVGLVLEACEAIAEAHAIGIIHRDIKPSNLFVASRRDGSKVVKVLDFGISKLTRKLDGATGDSRSMTGTAAALGSAWYMSPEQLQDAKHVDERSDIWSIGVVLHELLTAQPPFGGDSAAAVGARIVTASPQPLRTLRKEVPPQLERVVLRCLEKDPGSRYPDVAALARALEPFATSQAKGSVARSCALLDARAKVQQPGTHPAKSGRGWQIAVAVIVPALLGLTAWWAYPTSNANPRPSAEPPTEPPAPTNTLPASTAPAPLASLPASELSHPVASTSHAPSHAPPPLTHHAPPHPSKRAPAPSRSDKELDLLHPALDGR